MKRWWVKLLIALVVFSVLLWLSFLGSGVHSKNELERYKAELRKAGEKLELSDIVPAPVPPEQNALALFNLAKPVLALDLNDSLYKNSPLAMRLIAPARARVVFQQPEIQSDSGTNTWEELRTDLDKRAMVFEFLRALPGKPHLQFDLDYSKGFELPLPHLSQLKHSSQLASAAALCDLHEGHPAAAATNLHDALVLIHILDREPLLISQLVRFAMLQIVYSAQWEFLQATNLSEVGLAQLQSDWQQLELLGPMEAALNGEQVLGLKTIDQWRSLNKPPELFFGAASTSSGSSGDLWEDLKNHGREFRDRANFAAWRSSWSFEDQLFLLKTDQILLKAVRQICTNGFYKDALPVSEGETHAMSTTYRRANRLRILLEDEMMNKVSSPEWSDKSLNKLLAAEAAKQLAITGIALKRFQLKHGAWPASLDLLNPEFLKTIPRDPVDGQSLRYRLNADGSFLLYSLGTNALDDGGSGVSVEMSKSFSWQKGVDWVWPQPATAAEVEASRLLSTTPK